MLNVKRATVIFAALALIPNIGMANTDECPEMSGVLDVVQPKGTGEKINQTKLVEEVGKASASTEATRGLANELKDSLPGNPEAVVADLMITAYCEFLMTSQSDVALDESVENYQKVIYNDVFADPAGTVSDTDSRPDGWLMGN
ncbi:MAG: hypothetical protein AAF408_04030 [Pseudomonadota bacterium]